MLPVRGLLITVRSPPPFPSPTLTGRGPRIPLRSVTPLQPPHVSPRHACARARLPCNQRSGFQLRSLGPPVTALSDRTPALLPGPQGLSRRERGLRPPALPASPLLSVPTVFPRRPPLRGLLRQPCTSRSPLLTHKFTLGLTGPLTSPGRASHSVPPPRGHRATAQRQVPEGLPPSTVAPSCFTSREPPGAALVLSTWPSSFSLSKPVSSLCLPGRAASLHPRSQRSSSGNSGWGPGGEGPRLPPGGS